MTFNPLKLLHSGNHTWKFFRAGGFDQVLLRNGADLASLDQLDQKLWVALSCPTTGLEFDAKTLALIDTDKDGRVRAPEIIAATKWACGMLKNADELCNPPAALSLGSINDATPEGKQVLASAKQILINLGRPNETAIAVADVADTQKIFAQTRFNGDGIIPVDASDDAAVKAVVENIIACFGAQTDRSGKPGVNKAAVDAFFAEAQAHADWWAKAQAADVLPLGEGTGAASAAVAAVSAKVEDFFARCRLASFDGRALSALNRSEEEYLAISAKDLTITSAEISSLPLARVEAGGSLPLTTDGVNPAWAGAIATLHAAAVQPLLGERSRMSAADWAQVQAKLAPFIAWSAGKAGTKVEKLGLARVKEILAGTSRQEIEALLAKDAALEPEANSIAAVERLVHYHRDLFRLLNNYVNFRDFYKDGDRAVFQSGTLYLDQRSCNLCVRVDDMGKHAAMAHLSRTYLAYCDLTRKATGEKMTIAAAFTGGDSDNLMVGRNGLFYDRQGRDWDATITKVVDNPISIRQAFWSPYKRMLRWIEDTIAKRAAAADAASQDKLTTAATATGEAAAGKPPAAAPKIDIGVVAALGVAFAGISTALGVLLQAFFGLGYLMPVGIVALILLISGPSMIIAWLKLRQRNLGPILDANGWAVNARARVNIPFGGSLTRVATLPPGSSRDLVDPFADDNSGRYKFAAIVVLVLAGWGLWYFGAIEYVWPGVLDKSGYVERRENAAKAKVENGGVKAPAAPPATPPAATAPAGTI
ncbi:MAG: hypothetical protein NTW19_09255 [Planctomycetota bacterium]|nr:hypothetical protein [Planctomycetota bacterium]